MNENGNYLKENERLYVQNQNLFYKNKNISRKYNSFKKTKLITRYKSACLTKENAKLKGNIWFMLKDKEECKALKKRLMQKIKTCFQKI